MTAETENPPRFIDAFDRMTDEEKARALEKLVRGSYSIHLNMGDTFAFATAEGEDLDAEDAEELCPLIAKYGYAALTAYAAVARSIRGGRRVDPITCRCNHKSPAYYAARKEIVEMIGGPTGMLWDAMGGAGTFEDYPVPEVASDE